MADRTSGVNNMWTVIKWEARAYVSVSVSRRIVEIPIEYTSIVTVAVIPTPIREIGSVDITIVGVDSLPIRL